jgi:hypothetical protein
MTKWPQRRVLREPAPEQLARFVPSEWPGEDPLVEWRNACLVWLREAPGRRLPFGVFGDSVDVFRECLRVRRRAAGSPDPPPARRSQPKSSNNDRSE